jgi:hypothetical protein
MNSSSVGLRGRRSSLSFFRSAHVARCDDGEEYSVEIDTDPAEHASAGDAATAAQRVYQDIEKTVA